MNLTTMTNLSVDEYLDLYLLAKNLRDKTWQAEILAALSEFDLAKFEIKKDITLLLEEYEETKNNIIIASKAFLAEPQHEAHLLEANAYNQRKHEILCALQQKHRALAMLA